MEAPDGALVSGDEEDSPSLALLIPLELSPDVIAARMQDIALEDKESGGDIDSIKDGLHFRSVKQQLCWNG